MSARVGINGFGRMGRLALRAAWGWPELAFAHVNELHGDASTAAHLLTFDSVHGRWSEDVHGDGDVLDRQRERARLQRAAEPGDVPWGELGVEIVLECSGRFRTAEALEAYFRQGVRKVIVAAPVKEGALNVVVGVNDHLYEPRRHRSADRGLVHDQLPGARGEGDPRGHRDRARADHDAARHDQHADAGRRSAQGSAPGACRERLADPHHHRSATAIGLIFPELEGKLNGLAVRVPLLNASLTDCVFEVARATDGRGGQRPARGGGRRPAGGHPRLRAPAAGVGRLQGRSALGDRRRPLDDGDRRDPGEDPRLVRQRVGLREPPRRARAHRRRKPSRRGACRSSSATVGAMASGCSAAPCRKPRLQQRQGDLRNYALVTGGVLGGHARRRGDPHARPVLLRPARLHARCRSPRCSSSTRSRASSRTSSAAGSRPAWA